MDQELAREELARQKLRDALIKQLPIENILPPVLGKFVFHSLV